MDEKVVKYMKRIFYAVTPGICCYCGGVINRGDYYIQIPKCGLGSWRAHITCFIKRHRRKGKYVLEALKKKYGVILTISK